MRLTSFLVFATLALASSSLHANDLLDQLGLRKSSSSAGLTSFSQDQAVSALKEALARGVDHAITNLGRADGFLKDAAVRIPLPTTLQKVENGLRVVGQSHLAEEFVTTLNRAAEQAVPQAAGLLADAVRQMSLGDAKTIITSTNTAATDYFKRTVSTNLYARFLPIVKKATDQTGVTSAYKRMTGKVNLGGLSELGALGGLHLDKNSFDVDDYVTIKALDGLFSKIAEQEKLIRENPAARTSELLQKVFGTVARQNQR